MVRSRGVSRTAVSLVLLSTPLWPTSAVDQQQPDDVIKLDEANRNAERKVLPLDLADRSVPCDLQADRRVGNSSDRAAKEELPSRLGASCRSPCSSNCVLDEAEPLVEAKKLDEAFPYYEFLLRRYRKCLCLQLPTTSFSWPAPARRLSKRNTTSALRGHPFFTRNADYPGVAVAILRAAEKRSLAGSRRRILPPPAAIAQKPTGLRIALLARHHGTIS